VTTVGQVGNRESDKTGGELIKRSLTRWGTVIPSLIVGNRSDTFPEGKDSLPHLVGDVVRLQFGIERFQLVNQLVCGSSTHRIKSYLTGKGVCFAVRTHTNFGQSFGVIQFQNR
jgi:hypothetical protein